MKSKKRTLKQIRETLKEVEKLWKAHPYLRLGQLIANGHFEQMDMYYSEDEEFVDKIKKIYDRPSTK